MELNPSVVGRIQAIRRVPIFNTPQSWSRNPTVSGRGKATSDLQQATPQRDGDGMRSIVGAQFLHQILDVKIDRVL